MKPDVYYYTKDKIINVNANFQGKPLFFGPKHSTVLPERKALADLEFKNRDASAVSDEELWEDRVEYADFAKKVLAACRDPQVSYNQQIHSVVPEIALELQSLRREQHSDLEVFRRVRWAGWDTYLKGYEWADLLTMTERPDLSCGWKPSAGPQKKKQDHPDDSDDGLEILTSNDQTRFLRLPSDKIRLATEITKLVPIYLPREASHSRTTAELLTRFFKTSALD
jgi:hypothetical protein